MEAVILVTAWVGWIATTIALYQRVGFSKVEPDWREFLIPNWWWFGLMAAKIFLWPLTLGVWLYRRRPPTAWKAVTELDGRPARRIVHVRA